MMHTAKVAVSAEIRTKQSHASTMQNFLILSLVVRKETAIF
jgi:hypothetical protein